MSMHSFNPEVAAEVGVVPAVIYQNIVFWHARAVANGKHQHDGRTWVYNSVKAWAALFPYLTPKQIRGALEKLEEAGLVATGCYNQTPYDRTKWYCPLRQLDLPSGANRNASQGKPIPVSNPDIIQEQDSPAVAGPTIDDVAAATLAPKPTATKYRWHGNTIRLTERDFDRWQQSFSSLDLPAELESLDAWLSSPEATAQHRKGWFHVVAGALKNRNAAERAKKQTTNGAAKPVRRNTINAEPGKLYADLL